MRMSVFRCCMTSMGLAQYELSTNAVLQRLGVEFVDVKEFNCCGYPLKNANLRAYLLASARNLAIAEHERLSMFTLCNCCYGSLKHAAHLLDSETSIRDQMNRTLAGEGLNYRGTAQVRHLLQVLHDDIGIDVIREKLEKRYNGLRIATHYGCHILRPQTILQFDSAFSPVKFDRLVELTGAESVPWLHRLDCCGSPLMGVNDELSMDLTEKKLASAREAGADFICVACPYCQMQFDRVQEMMLHRRHLTSKLPSIVYPQLIGLCLGIDPKHLGLDKNRLSPDNLESHLVS